jgi:signal transduction histidine kinase
VVEANRLKSDFVSTMSHELRTPLDVITGYAEILCDPELGRLGDEHAIAARGIARSAAELLELVTKTLDLSRLELGVDSLRIERVVPSEPFAEVEAVLASLARPGACGCPTPSRRARRSRSSPIAAS